VTTAPPAPPAERHDAALIALIVAPPEFGETHEQAFRRKEGDVCAFCAKLPVLDAMALHKRLANARPGDRLAEHFHRFTVERRIRILNFLAGARRRAAIAASR
jgi:hypothetical protein